MQTRSELRAIGTSSMVPGTQKGTPTTYKFVFPYLTPYELSWLFQCNILSTTSSFELARFGTRADRSSYDVVPTLNIQDKYKSWQKQCLKYSQTNCHDYTIHVACTEIDWSDSLAFSSHQWRKRLGWPTAQGGPFGQSRTVREVIYLVIMILITNIQCVIKPSSLFVAFECSIDPIQVENYEQRRSWDQRRENST